jgi:polar amino acid transport system substrate-binding protein
MEFDSVITSVESGAYDIALAALTVSEERALHVNFSNTYFNASQYIIVSKNNTVFDNLTTKEEVETAINNLGSDAKIGFQRGTTGQYYAEGDADWGFEGFSSAENKGYSNGAQAIADLKIGRINIIVIDEMPARSIVAANSDDVKLIEVPLTEEEYAIGVNKNKTDLLEKINASLQKFIDDGSLQAIVDKYYTGNQ